MATDPRLQSWLGSLREALDASGFVRLQLNKPAEEAEDLKSVDVRPLMIKGDLKLSFTFHYKTNDIVKNYSFEESAAMLTALLSGKFANARMFTLSADLQLSRQGEGFALHKHPASEAKAPQLDHNRAKQRIVAGDKGWMHALGLTDTKGAVLPTAQDKYRQINKYIEVLDGLVKQLPERKTIKIADMGAGKGYLTFALYDHLANTLKRKAVVTGVEYRPDLVALCNDTAQASGFDGLRFVPGTIEDYDCAGADIVIALHACDTATDDAIAKAVHADASLIVVAPCCHKQIRREMEKGVKAGADNPLDFLMKYGTYTERIAEMVTDGLRAEMLELSGYKTNLFEFISDTHTPKNVMIVASKLAQPGKNLAKIAASIEATKAQFGIGEHYLEGLLANRAPA
jgi:SAM-dependent methyltransferase